MTLSRTTLSGIQCRMALGTTLSGTTALGIWTTSKLHSHTLFTVILRLLILRSAECHSTECLGANENMSTFTAKLCSCKKLTRTCAGLSISLFILVGKYVFEGRASLLSAGCCFKQLHHIEESNRCIVVKTCKDLY
jgi:hypothetical protein